MVEKGKHRPLPDPRTHILQRSCKEHAEKVGKLLQGKEVLLRLFNSFCAELIKDHAEDAKFLAISRYSKRWIQPFSIFRELGTDAKTASLYANTIGKQRPEYLIDKFKEFLETLKTSSVYEKDEATWKERYLESKFKLNTFIFRIQDKEDKKAKQADKKRHSEFIDLMRIPEIFKLHFSLEK